jgi:hypothetical protein
MRHYNLTNAQKAATGGLWTDLYVIPWDDATLAAGDTDDTPVAVTLDAIADGDLIQQNTLVEIVTAWASGAADVAPQMTCTVSVGITGDATAFQGTALTIITTGTGVAAGALGITDTTTDVPYEGTGSTNLLATFTPSNTTCMADSTAGEVWVWVNHSRRSERSQFLGA